MDDVELEEKILELQKAMNDRGSQLVSHDPEMQYLRGYKDALEWVRKQPKEWSDEQAAES